MQWAFLPWRAGILGLSAERDGNTRVKTNAKTQIRHFCGSSIGKASVTLNELAELESERGRVDYSVDVHLAPSLSAMQGT
jgi:hypothetical protein